MGTTTLRLSHYNTGTAQAWARIPLPVFTASISVIRRNPTLEEEMKTVTNNNKEEKDQNNE
jgi:hypothetical protein